MEKRMFLVLAAVVGVSTFAGASFAGEADTSDSTGTGAEVGGDSGDEVEIDEEKTVDGSREYVKVVPSTPEPAPYVWTCEPGNTTLNPYTCQ